MPEFSQTGPQKTVTSEGPAALLEVLRLFRRRWLVLAASALLFGVAFYVLSFIPTPRYRAETLVAIANSTQDGPQLGALSRQIGGLSSLLGGGGAGGKREAAIATLKSRQLLRQFIQKNKLLPVLFSDQWNKEDKKWKGLEPDLWVATDRFLRGVLSVSEDPKSGLLKLSIRWKDPVIAATWANDLILLADHMLMEAGRKKAQRNIAYLFDKLNDARSNAIRTSLASLLMNEQRTLMLTDGRERYAFEVIDPAMPPPEGYYEWPRHLVYAVVGVILGGLLGIFLAIALEGRKSSTGISRKS